MKKQMLPILAATLMLWGACKKNQVPASETGTGSTNKLQIESTSTLQVDCGVSYGGFINLPSRANITFTGGTIGGVPLKTTDNNYLIANHFGVRAARLFISPNTVQSSGWANYDNYMNDAKRVPDSLLIVLSGDAKGVGDTAVFRSLTRSILTHLWGLTTKIKYIEALNEYERQGVDDSIPANVMTDTEYYNYYKIIYEEVNSFNTNHALTATTRLLVGGPCLGNWQTNRIQTFLTNYKNDTSTAKKLDFVSYHEYCSWNASTANGGTQAGQLIQLGTRRSTFEGYLSARGLSTNIPLYITEHGIFPGEKLRQSHTEYDTTTHTYLLMQAASAATYNYYYITTGGGKIRPFLWDTRFDSNNEKSVLAPSSLGTNIPTPFGNMLKALTLLGPERVKATASGINATSGYGTYGLATKSDTSVNVLVWNWQHTAGVGNSVNITFTNLPASFTGHAIKLTQRLIDGTHCNYINGIATAPLTVTGTVTNFNTASNYNLNLNPNAVALITLSLQ